jgi:hypothetical protein
MLPARHEGSLGAVRVSIKAERAEPRTLRWTHVSLSPRRLHLRKVEPVGLHHRLLSFSLRYAAVMCPLPFKASRSYRLLKS